MGVLLVIIQLSNDEILTQTIQRACIGGTSTPIFRAGHPQLMSVHHMFHSHRGVHRSFDLVFGPGGVFLVKNIETPPVLMAQMST